MRACFAHLEELLDRALTVPGDGDVAEIGVWQGGTFAPMARKAIDAGRACHAIDSFCGMAPPTPEDLDPADGSCELPHGSLDPGGTGPLLHALAEQRLAPQADPIYIWQGFVPHVLQQVTVPHGLCFAHVDVAHYTPTLQALAWAWHRLHAGGVLVCHDWYPDKNHLASGGCKAFMRATGVELAGSNETGHGWFIR